MSCRPLRRYGKCGGVPLKVAFDLTQFCARPWTASTVREVGVRVRPLLATGFEYEYTTAGQSGFEEPQFPQVLGDTVQDGSAVITARALSNDSLEKTIESVSWDGGPYTINGQNIVNDNGQQLLGAMVDGTAASGKYLIIATVTFDDATYDQFAVEVGQVYVSLETAKDFINVYYDEKDAEITLLIQAAERHVANFLGKALDEFCETTGDSPNEVTGLPPTIELSILQHVAGWWEHRQINQAAPLNRNDQALQMIYFERTGLGV